MNDSIDDVHLQPSAHPARILDEDEVRRWFAESRTHAWMSQEYERRYNITTTPSLWADFARRCGPTGVTARGAELIPWAVAPEHGGTTSSRSFAWSLDAAQVSP